MLIGIPSHWRFAPLLMGSLQTVSNHLARTSTGHLAKCAADCCATYTPKWLTLSGGSSCSLLVAGTYEIIEDLPLNPCTYTYAGSVSAGNCVMAGVTATPYYLEGLVSVSATQIITDVRISFLVSGGGDHYARALYTHTGCGNHTITQDGPSVLVGFPPLVNPDPMPTVSVSA